MIYILHISYIINNIKWELVTPPQSSWLGTCQLLGGHWDLREFWIYVCWISIYVYIRETGVYVCTYTDKILLYKIKIFIFILYICNRYIDVFIIVHVCIFCKILIICQYNIKYYKFIIWYYIIIL